MQNLDETILMCQRGSVLAWESLIRKQQSRVYAIALYFLKNKADAEDITQEVFVKIYKNIKNYRSEKAEFVPWMLAITRNCCLDRLRKKEYRGRHEIDLEGLNHEPQTSEQSLEIGLIEQQNKRLLYQALDHLSEESREIILMKDIQGQKNEDLAEILSLPIGTIKSRSSRARMKLAKLMLEMKGNKTNKSGAV